MAYEYKFPLTYSVNNTNNCTSLFTEIYTYSISYFTNENSTYCHNINTKNREVEEYIPCHCHHQ